MPLNEPAPLLQPGRRAFVPTGAMRLRQAIKWGALVTAAVCVLGFCGPALGRWGFEITPDGDVLEGYDH